jgi:hypothetical protein
MRFVLCVLLALVAAPAWAEWLPFGETHIAVHYFDPDTIRKNDDRRKMWQGQDLKQQNNNGVMSRRILWEYDCKENRKRVLSFSSHSGPMMTGKTLTKGNDSRPWSAIPPGTGDEVLLKIVCTK